MYKGQADKTDDQFFGFSFASALSIYYLQQENKIASSLLVASVEELQQSTGKVSTVYRYPDSSP